MSKKFTPRKPNITKDESGLKNGREFIIIDKEKCTDEVGNYGIYYSGGKSPKKNKIVKITLVNNQDEQKNIQKREPKNPKPKQFQMQDPYPKFKEKEKPVYNEEQKKAESIERLDNLFNKKNARNMVKALNEIKEVQKDSKRKEGLGKMDMFLSNKKTHDRNYAFDELKERVRSSKKKEATDRLSNILLQKKSQQDKETMSGLKSLQKSSRKKCSAEKLDSILNKKTKQNREDILDELKNNLEKNKKKEASEMIVNLLDRVVKEKKNGEVGIIKEYNEAMDKYMWTKPEKHFIMQQNVDNTKERNQKIEDAYIEFDCKDTEEEKEEQETNGEKHWTANKGKWDIKKDNDDDSIYNGN